MKAYQIISYLLLNTFLLVNTLPIFSSTVNEAEAIDTLIESTTLTSSLLPTSTIVQIATETSTCPDTDYEIPVERFAQLLSTHWQFDHLDAIKSGTYRIISEQFQKRIKVSIEPKSVPDQVAPQNNRQRSFRLITASSWDMMDLEILHAQLFGAIQAHTEGSLHLAWDRLADKLGQPAFEAYIRTIALKYCPNENMFLSSDCLAENASQLSFELDDYIQQNLIEVFTALDVDVLPQLLSNTSKDLLDVLAYFNRLFSLGDNQQLYLKVTPWTQQTDSLKAKLLPLLDNSISIDDHLIDFFSSYACLSR
jgi:hypothetical protein